MPYPSTRPSNTILEGVVGSQAYGLQTPYSDVDILGVYVHSTEDLFDLNEPKQTHVINADDYDATFHEVGKFFNLCLKCNPSLLELLWLPNYSRMSDWGQAIIEIRDSFLSRDRVRNAYIGYVYQQFTRLKARNNTTFASDTGRRVAKHARHLARLTQQYVDLHRTGDIQIKVSNPTWYRDFGIAVASGNLDLADRQIEWAKTVADSEDTVLPEEPDFETVNTLFKDIRHGFYR